MCVYIYTYGIICMYMYVLYYDGSFFMAQLGVSLRHRRKRKMRPPHHQHSLVS